MAAISTGGGQVHASLVQPIVFCGPGNNLYPLCSNTVATDDSQNILHTAQNVVPKAMLPVLNRPMIAFALQQLVSAGFRHAIVFACSDSHSTIAAALKSLILIPPTLTQSGKKNVSSAAVAAAAAAVEEASRYPNVSVSVGLNSSSAVSTATEARNPYLSADSFAVSSVQNETVMRVDLLPLGPDDVTSSKTDSRVSNTTNKYKTLGTAGLISWLHSLGRLDKDPLILPVDLITQSISLTNIINNHISHIPNPPTLTCLLYQRGAGEGTGKEREKDGPPKLFSTYNLSSPSNTPHRYTTHQLLLLQDSDDISDLDTSNLHLRMSLLWSHPHLRISTSLLDSHIYLFNLPHLLCLLQTPLGKRMKSLREEVVPFMAKCSWRRGLREKTGWIHPSNRVSNAASFMENELPEWRTHSLLDGGEANGGVRVNAVVVRGGFVVRANTVPTYLEANRYLLRCLSNNAQPNHTLHPSTLSHPLPNQSPPPPPPSPTTSSSINNTVQTTDTSSPAKLQISADSLIHPTTHIANRTTIKRSLIGANCTIATNVKLTNVILMDHVKISDHCKLENCIVSVGSHIAEKCNLKDCDVASHIHIPSATCSKGEKFDA